MSALHHLGAPGEQVAAWDVPGWGAFSAHVFDHTDDTNERDVAELHRWVTARGAGFYNLAHLSREQLADLYRVLSFEPDHHAYMLRRDGLRVALVQTYTAATWPIANLYDARPGDVGLHVLIGARGPRTPNTTGLLMDAMVRFAFAASPDVHRLVGDPDERNEAIVRVALEAGFVPGPVVQDSSGRSRRLLVRRASA